MPKSDLQKRAERAAERFILSARKPVVIEFAGVPKAGKTTTLNQVQSFLKRCGFRVEVVIERASVCPIKDKKHANFNVWTACTTLAQILEKTQDPPRIDDPHVLILDRGIFDAISWFRMMEKLERIRTNDRITIEDFLRIADWRERITGVIVMVASPKDAMKREKGLLPVEDAGGSIMNEEVLGRMLEITKETAHKLKEDFNVYMIDTSSGATKSNPRKTAEKVVDIVLSLIEEQLQEDILCLSKSKVTKWFKGRTTVHATDADELSNMFLKSGSFRPREEVEANLNLVQALPVVIVRNKSGEILRLRRRERSVEKALHEKLVIWAGGHVRKEDAKNGHSIVHCALRELQEELRLSLEADDLKLLGAVYANAEGSIGKHAAIVYEWRAETDDVAVALSASEFFERRGTSLSGKFVDLSTLASDIDANKVSEVWSVEIVRELLAKDSHKFKNQGLFSLT